MWKDIIGFEGIYKIDEYGTVLNVLTNSIRSPYISNKGYKLIDLYKDGIRYKFSIHKLVAIHFVPNPYNLPIVLHLDNNKLNTYYTNLKWGTYSENNSQAIKDGLNKLPTPDNRRYYEVFNNTVSFYCKGASSIIDMIGYGNDSMIRNLLYRQTQIRDGLYKGFYIRKSDMVDVQRSVLNENVDP